MHFSCVYNPTKCSTRIKGLNLRRGKTNTNYRIRIIKLLSTKRMRPKDLLKESAIPRSTLYRILDELIPELVTKQNGYYVWYQHIQYYE